MSAYENITGLGDALTVSNDLSDGILAYAFPVLIFVAAFQFTLSQGRGHAITTASFITALILLFENMLDLIPYWVIIADMVLFAVGIFMVWMERRAHEA